MARKNWFIRHSTVLTGSSRPRTRFSSHRYMPRVRQGVISQASSSSPRIVQKLVLPRITSISFSSCSWGRRPSREADTRTLFNRGIRSLPVKAEKPCINSVGRFTISAISSAVCQWSFSTARAFMRNIPEG